MADPTNPLRALLTVVGNERSSAMLFDYESQGVAAVKEQIARQETSIEELKKSLGTSNDIRQRFVQAMELEVLRWNYVLHAYHTTRFRKIQSLVSQMLIPTESKLSPPEKAFCQSLSLAFETAMEGGAATFLEETEDFSGFVFFQPVVDMGATLLSQSPTAEALPLKHTDIYLSRLEHVRELRESGKIVLI
jgi:hypothetical protein